jgi:queuine tRNA-ribosyltransferase
MVLDECIATPATRETARGAMERSVRWATRGRARFQQLKTDPGALVVSNPGQVQFGIVQGGTFLDLRRESVARTIEIGFEAYAIGGLSVGEPRAVTDELVGLLGQRLPADRPRYLMGVGEPDQLVGYAALGIDMFDCVSPTRLGRTGYAYTSEGRLNVTRAGVRADAGPVDRSCACRTCSGYSRAYLHHLFRAGEPLGPRLLSLHNVAYLVGLLKRARAQILDGTFSSRLGASAPSMLARPGRPAG